MTAPTPLLWDLPAPGVWVSERVRSYVVTEPPKVVGPAPRHADDVAGFIRACLADLDADREHFLVLAVNPRNAIIGAKVVGSGGMASCPASPLDVYRAALVMGAHGVIVAHNHPSGDPTPSANDDLLTERLEAAGNLLGVRLLDHLVVTTGPAFVSYRNLGRLASPTI